MGTILRRLPLIKDTVNRIGDLMDDGVPNFSFEG